ncbi:GNAT family N-acetyltransferase [Paracoccus sp. p4-l81]|uniref:GNAT family N-acetyltransferase n=1 Tax=unclassified Paracoccus (in: a-proteobacteria) TaxID=2688777 RepID=UPI0035B6B0DF
MEPLIRGRYRARLAQGQADLRAAQALRWQAFRVKRGLAEDGGLDADDFDAACHHMLIEDSATGDLVCCSRLLMIEGGAGLARSYSAQYYNLAALRRYPGRMAELGRFCLRPGVTDPNVMRLAWGALSRLVADRGVDLLFGCSSFTGTEVADYEDAFAMLKDRHLAPRRWLPRVKAPNVFRFARALARRQPDSKKALLSMPPLLRSYLAMGGWVSDHAVVDRDLNTLHVFTGLEIRAIPPARARSITGAAAG